MQLGAARFCIRDRAGAGRVSQDEAYGARLAGLRRFVRDADESLASIRGIMRAEDRENHSGSSGARGDGTR